MNERCMCGAWDCPSCGRAQGTYVEREEPDPDEAYEKLRQDEVDAEDEP